MKVLHDDELPHAGVMRWVREADAEGLTTRANVLIEATHPFVRGGKLFPSALIEVMAQGAAAGFAIRGRTTGQRIKQGLLVGMRGFEVFAAVKAGDDVEVRGVEERHWGSLWQFAMEARVGEVLVARSGMTFHLQFE